MPDIENENRPPEPPTSPTTPSSRIVELASDEVLELRQCHAAERKATQRLRVAVMRLEAELMDAQQASIDVLQALAEKYDFNPALAWELQRDGTLREVPQDPKTPPAAVPGSGEGPKP